MKNTRSEFFLKSLVIISFITMITINALANILPINGLNTGEVSNSYPNLFTPAPVTFSIWGLIYILLGTHILYQLGLFRKKEKGINKVLLKKVGILFSVSSLVNSAWIFAWHYKLIPLSMVLMILLLICLIKIITNINTQKLSVKENFFIRMPFSIYFGWITVATIANATALLVSIGWKGFGLPESIWTIIVLAVATIIGIATTLRFKDVSYGLVFIWAYIGILIKHTSSWGFFNEYPSIIITIIICIVIFVIIEGKLLLVPKE